jgi:diguanylate cyclase (GGDEF)-like protein/PAS domain S-box-containing protein
LRPNRSQTLKAPHAPIATPDQDSTVARSEPAGGPADLPAQSIPGEASKAEANLKALIESTTDPIWSVDMDFRLLAANATVRRYIQDVYGTDLQIGDPVSAAMPPADSALWEEFYRRALENGHYQTEYNFPSGRTLVFTFNEIVSDGRQVGISVIGRDVTEERVALKSQRLLAAVVEGSDEAIHAITLDGRIASWNLGGERMLGYAADEVMGKRLLDTIVLPERAPVMSWLMAEIAEGRSVGPYDTVLRHKDGHRIDVSVSIAPVRDQQGNIGGGAAYARDIRRRRHTELQLRDSEERYRSTFEQAAIGIVHSGFDGIVLRCNARFASMLGYRPRDLVGRSLTSITAPEHVAKTNEFVRSIASGTAATANFEKAYLHRNGSRIWSRITVSAQRDGQGTPIHLVSFIEDINEQRSTERELSMTQRALDQTAARYGLVFNNTLDAITINRLSDGVYIDCNPAFTTITGYSREEIVGKSSLELGIWADSAARLAIIEKLSRDGICRSYETQFRKKSGELLWGEMSATRIDVDGEPCLLAVSRDISAAKEAETLLAEAAERIRLSEQRYAAVFRTSSDGILIVRRDGGAILDANPTFLQFMGFERGEIVGKTAHRLHLWADATDRGRWLHLMANSSVCQNFEVRLRKKSGDLVWALLSATMLDIDGVSSVIVIVRDITAAKAAESEIRTLAFYDALTGLPNRRLLLERLQQALATGIRTGRSRALLFVDLDNFKIFNDTLGHQTGDLILCEIGRRIAGSVRESDTVARLGGDEFVVMLLDLSLEAENAAEQARHTAEKILAAVEKPCLIEGRECRFTCSVGITLFGSSKTTAEEILQQADIAMYEAKAAGRNTMHFFAPSLQAAVHARAAIEEQLRHSLGRDEFLLYFQPQIDNSRLTGVECLLRWQHPQRGVLAPGEFIRIAEESGLILPLGALVLDQACARIAAWAANPRTEPLAVAVNVSAVQLRQPDFVASVLQALERNGANPERLNLELTESMLVDSMEEAIAKMTALKKYGIHFSLDDFGTGYSSLAYLKRLPLDHLKIDRTFIRDILDDHSSGAIAETIVSLGRAMGMGVIAEGVETAEQHQYLLGLGCHCFQGYLFGRPVPIEAFERAWLEPGDATR